MNPVKYRVKIAEQDFEELRRLVSMDLPNEAGAFALAGVAEHSGGWDIIVRRPIAIPKNLLSIQAEYRLEISTQAVNGLIALCERSGLGAVLCHSHPEKIPYSLSDDLGEHRIFEVLRQFIPRTGPTASLLFYPGGFEGRVWLPNSAKPIPISEIVILGRHLKRIQPAALPTFRDDLNGEILDRQVRAFGTDGQRLISRTKIAIVGVGGTGSPTAEQITRLGVKDLVLIDPDDVEPSNLTRVYGTFASDLQKSFWRFGKRKPPKVELVAAHLRRINPAARIQAIPKNVILGEAASKLLDRDIIFLCTDNQWSRSIVNQIAYQHFIPTINLGARIDARDGTITGAVGTVDVLRPDEPCLWCSQFLRAERIAAESMPTGARKALEEQGYVEGIDDPAPSVISINTAISGMAVTLFLELVTDFMAESGNISRLNFDFMDGTVRRGRATILNVCVCKKVRGFGDLKALPTLEDIGFLES